MEEQIDRRILCYLLSFASKQLIAFGELLMFQVVQQEALTRLLGKKGYSPGRSFWDGEGAGSGDE